MAERSVDTDLTIIGSLDATSINQNGIPLVLSTLISSSGLGVVVHGTDPNVSRPTEFAAIQWVGSVEPINSINGDTWVNTT